LIREATLGHELVPVFCGTAVKNKGVQPLLDAVVRYLPSPLDRQVTAIDVTATDKARAAAEGQHVDSVRVDLSTSSSDPLVAMAFKTVIEQFGQLTYFRIYQGKIAKGDSFTNTRTGKKVRFGRLVRMHANDRVDI